MQLRKMTSSTAMISGENVGTTVQLPKCYTLNEITCNLRRVQQTFKQKFQYTYVWDKGRIPPNTAMFIAMSRYMFISQQPDDGELRPKSVAVLLNKHIFVGRNVKKFVNEYAVMFILVQWRDGTSHTSHYALLPAFCS